jgi:hypothetical protein
MTILLGTSVPDITVKIAPYGPTGANGPPGPGVAPGGTVGQVLTKNSSIDYDTHWLAAAGGGNVSTSGTPITGQLAAWTDATHIQGVNAAALGYAPLTSPIFTGDPQAPTPATADNDTSIATTAFVKAQSYLTTAVAASTYQLLDADLTAIAALTGTNTIYYRSAADTWSPVNISTGLAFSGGNLTATAVGGNVSNSGTPTAAQYAKWVTATTIQGVSTATVLSDIGAQPLDADLTAIAALTGTNVIYYRSAADTWAAVTIGTGLTFTSGTLAASVAVANGNYGDITVSGTGNIWTVNAGVVTYSKIQNVSATSRVLGRITTGAGSAEELTGANVKTIVGSGDLTKTDDANVTLALGGTPVGALYSAVSLTLGWTGTLAVPRGGTGLGSVTQGDLLYGSAVNTLTALAKDTTAAQSRYLSNTGGSNNPAWAQVNLANGVTGALPASSLTGTLPAASFPALTGDVTTTAGAVATTIAGGAVSYAKIQNVSTTARVIGRKTAGVGSAEECSLSDVLDFVGSAAQGDILYRGASTWARLGSGISGQFLQTQGAAANPIWATLAGGGNVSNSGTPANGQLAQWIDATHIQGIAASSLGFAPLASPIFTGDPQAPTAALADNDTSLATTAFVKLHLLRGHIGGLALANDGTTPNTVLDIAVGACVDSTGLVPIKLTSAFTKSIAGAWAAGSGSNGMGIGLTAAASTWYHVFAIINAGNTDIYFDTSVTAANAPAGTIAYRRIGSIRTDASVHITSFNQIGDYFYIVAVSVFGPTGGSVALQLFGVIGPTGVVFQPLLESNLSATGGSIYFQLAPAADSAKLYTANMVQNANAGIVGNYNIVLGPPTNILGQIYMGDTLSGGTANVQVWSIGWVDTRGKNL